ncbi:hypothetical protein BJY04DRAFT_189711 [Aspergillus karnatakaensis]|uniref:uncharacterized protein n=1 Tax=Aspergillus karnatakaensis TaxID=1810916 RepID=UPI003CCDC89E
MSKLLHKIRDVFSGHDSKAKHHNRGSHLGVYDGHDGPKSSRYGSMSGMPGNRLGYESYRTDDYGSRFGSYGTKPRPGTYGSGDYSSNTRLDPTGFKTNSYASDYGPRSDGRSYSPGPMYGINSVANSYDSRSDAGVRARQGFEGGTVGSSNYRGSGHSYEYKDRMESHMGPTNHVQRSRW